MPTDLIPLKLHLDVFQLAGVLSSLLVLHSKVRGKILGSHDGAENHKYVQVNITVV